MYVYGIKNMTFQLYIIEVDASDLVGRGGNVHVNLCWTKQIILKTFCLSFTLFHQIFINFYFLSDKTHIFHFNFLVQIKKCG